MLCNDSNILDIKNDLMNVIKKLITISDLKKKQGLNNCYANIKL